MSWNLPSPGQRNPLVELEVRSLLAVFLASILARVGWELGGWLLHKLL